MGPALGASSQNLPAPEKTDSTLPAAAILQAVAADLRHVDSKSEKVKRAAKMLELSPEG